MSNTTNTFSLFDKLTDASGETFGVTDLIKYLLQTTSHDVCSVRRNAMSSYRVVHRAQEIYSEINRLIRAVETDKDDDWSNFEKYIGAIDPLESRLFAIADFIEKESILWLPQDSTVEGSIVFIKDWADSRTRLQDLYKELQGILTPSSTNNQSVVQAQRHDDLTLFSALCRDVANHPLRDEAPTIRRGTGLISSLKNVISDISSKIVPTTSETSLVLSIKCAMIIHGVMQVSKTSEDTVLKRKLRTPDVWLPAYTLTNNMMRHLTNATGAPSIAALQKEYDDFLTFLVNLPGVGELPPQYYELRKLARSVNRPYHAQTIELVKQCLKLALHFNTNKDADVAPNPPTAAIKDAHAALVAAASAMTGMGNFTYAETSPASRAFSAAEVTIKGCFQDYGLRDWAVYEAKMQAAAKNDKDRVDQMNKRLDRVNTGSLVKSKDKISLTITPLPSSTKLLKSFAKNASPTKYDIDPDTLLSAVLWHEALADSSLLQGYHFEQEIGVGRSAVRKRMELHETVKDIQGTGPARSIYLVSD